MMMIYWPLWNLGDRGRSHPAGQFVGCRGHPRGFGQNGGGHRVGHGHGAYASGAHTPARTRAMDATAEEADAVGCRSGRGSYGTPGSKRGVARAATRIHPVPVLPGVQGSGLD